MRDFPKSRHTTTMDQRWEMDVGREWSTPTDPVDRERGVAHQVISMNREYNH